MKKMILVLLSVVSFFSFQNIAIAATSEVTWKDYKEYRDIYPGNSGSKKSFREQTFKNFEKHFTKLAAKLPEDQILKIEVTNVDLAGDTRVGGINNYRIVKSIYFPSMKFSYQLLAKDGTVLKKADVDIKDMNFMTGSNLKYRNDSLGYEKKMLDEWFEDTFKDDFVKKS